MIINNKIQILISQKENKTLYDKPMPTLSGVILWEGEGKISFWEQSRIGVQIPLSIIDLDLKVFIIVDKSEVNLEFSFLLKLLSKANH